MDKGKVEIGILARLSLTDQGTSEFGFQFSYVNFGTNFVVFNLILVLFKLSDPEQIDKTKN